MYHSLGWVSGSRQHFLHKIIVVSGNAVNTEMARASVPLAGQARANPECFRLKAISKYWVSPEELEMSS